MSSGATQPAHMPRNATLEAIGEHCAAPRRSRASSVPFSSRRRWSALQLGATTYVLGAPELFPPSELEVLAERRGARRPPRRRVRHRGRRGRRRLDSDDRRAARARHPQRAPARRRARDDRVPPIARRSHHGHLRRPARNGRRGRSRRRDRRRRAARRARAAARPRGAPHLLDESLGDRPHRAGGQEARRRGARRGRPLRRDDRRRRERRAGAEGGAARDRTGQRLADGAGGAGPRPRPRRLRKRAHARRRRAQGASEPPARREALRREVGVRVLPRPLDRADAAAVPAPAATSHARCSADDRHPGASSSRSGRAKAGSGRSGSCSTSDASPFRPAPRQG